MPRLASVHCSGDPTISTTYSKIKFRRVPQTPCHSILWQNRVFHASLWSGKQLHCTTVLHLNMFHKISTAVSQPHSCFWTLMSRVLLDDTGHSLWTRNLCYQHAMCASSMCIFQYFYKGSFHHKNPWEYHILNIQWSSLILKKRDSKAEIWLYKTSPFQRGSCHLSCAQWCLKIEIKQIGDKNDLTPLVAWFSNLTSLTTEFLLHKLKGKSLSLASSPEPRSFRPAAGIESSGFVQHRSPRLTDFSQIWQIWLAENMKLILCTCSENQVRPELLIPATGQKDRGSGNENVISSDNII